MIPDIQRPESDFAIEIGFEPETGFDPARVSGHGSSAYPVN
jgi:hypothetical protein